MLETVDRWDKEKGSYGALAYVALKQLFRYYWKEVSVQPQTGIQYDARVREFDTAFRTAYDTVPPAEQAAKELGISQKAVEKCRNRIGSGCGRVMCLSHMEEESETILTDGVSAEEMGMRKTLDREFVEKARRLLEGDILERIVFECLVQPGNESMSNQELADVIELITGIRLSKQQVYWIKYRLAIKLVDEGALDISGIRQRGKWLDRGLAGRRRKRMRKAKRYPTV